MNKRKDISILQFSVLFVLCCLYLCIILLYMYSVLKCYAFNGKAFEWVGGTVKMQRISVDRVDEDFYYNVM